jgi:hypothetical protein
MGCDLCVFVGEMSECDSIFFLCIAFASIILSSVHLVISFAVMLTSLDVSS